MFNQMLNILALLLVTSVSFCVSNQPIAVNKPVENQFNQPPNSNIPNQPVRVGNSQNLAGNQNNRILPQHIQQQGQAQFNQNPNLHNVQPPQNAAHVALNQPGNALNHPANMGNTLNQPVNMGNGLNQPVNMGNGLNQPANMGNGLNQPMNMGNGLHQPVNMGNGLNQPVNMGNGLNQPANMGNGLHQPVNMGNGLNQPVNMGNGLNQPANMGNGLNQPANMVNPGLQPRNQAVPNLQNLGNPVLSRNSQDIPPQGFVPGRNFADQNMNRGMDIIDDRQNAIDHHNVLLQQHSKQDMMPPNQGFAAPPQPNQNQRFLRDQVPENSKKVDDDILSHRPACIHDITKVCDSSQYNLDNNVDVIECLSLEENLIWSYKVNITQNKELHSVVDALCQQALKNFPQCAKDNPDGGVTSCLLENRKLIGDPACIDFLTKIEVIIFNDYHLIDGFIKECKADIERYHCGKLDSKPEDMEAVAGFHSQEDVIACLEEHLDESMNGLSTECDKQIMRLAELSANDYHLDRHLYMSCKNDRENLCSDVVAGEGRVYKCLFDHKLDVKMTPTCREALTNRQQLIGKDYKASYSLARNCRVDIERNQCDIPLPQGSHLADSNHHVHLASVLMCLEKSSAPPSKECQAELISYRKMLLTDYEITPEITANCAREIVTKCDKGLEKGGKTLHCLFGLAQEENALGEPCNQALLLLLKDSEVAKDYRMDPVLASDCGQAVAHKCADLQDGDPMILGCLLEHLHDSDFDGKCRRSMIEVQYFISRDFSVDPLFREACEADARRICNTPDLQVKPPNPVEKDEAEFTLPFSLVLSCLYRNIIPNENNEHKPVSDECADRVHDAIRQRALDVNLNPDLEHACRHDLGEYCSLSIHQQGTEFKCLQDNYEKLSERCRDVVTELTKDEGENVLDFDDILVEECKAMLDEFCGDLMQENDEGKIMQCLINNKANMKSRKCAAGITHFQLIEMKNYNMNFNFFKACTNDVKKFCSEESSQSAAELIKCLSKRKRDHVLGDGSDASSLSPECTAEISVEKLQMHENLLLNDDLHKSCDAMYQTYCKHIQTGEAEAIECLREHKKDLDKECFKALFELEKEEGADPKLDYKLMHSCKEEIDEFCWEEMEDEEADYVFECLVRNKKNIKNKNCEGIVVEREKELFSDIALNVELNRACEHDIASHCHDEKFEALQDHNEGKDPHGVIYDCLKEKFATKELTLKCHEHVELVIREQQQDYKLDPQLVLACTSTIEKLCNPVGQKNVVECLKSHYFSSEMQDESTCMMEVAKLLRDGQTDIKADPVLEETCAQDLKQYCSRVPEGQGRLIACLVAVADDPERSLSPQCKEEIAIRRNMWKEASKKNIKGFADLHQAMKSSEHYSYITSVLTLSVFIILIFGVFCGRITRKLNRLRTRRKPF